jgi:hypothetical protein
MPGDGYVPSSLGTVRGEARFPISLRTPRHTDFVWTEAPVYLDPPELGAFFLCNHD